MTDGRAPLSSTGWLLWAAIAAALVLALLLFARVRGVREPAVPPPAAEAPGAAPALSEHHLREFRRKGLDNPVRDVLADLFRKPELIPHEPVLGGTMFFVPEESQLLTDRWVLATYEDGHIRGRAIFQYTVADTGDIAWRVIEAYLD